MFLKFLKWRREVAPGGSVLVEQVRKELAQDKVCMGGVDRAGRPFLVAFPARHFSAGRTWRSSRVRTHLWSPRWTAAPPMAPSLVLC